MAAKPWTDEELAWAQDCRREGDSVVSIAESAERSVDDVCAKLGINATQARRAKPGDGFKIGARGPLPTDTVGTMTKEEAASLVSGGMTMAAVARQAGVSRERMGQVMSQMGIFLKRKNARGPYRPRKV